MRFLRIATGYLAAAYCASFMVMLIIGRGEPPSAALFLIVPLTALLGTMFAVPFTIVQAGFFIALTEIYRIRKLGYYVLTGAATALIAVLPFAWQDASARLTTVVLWGPAGVVCAMVYWLVAGRQAGEPSPPGVPLLYCLGEGLTLGALVTGIAAILPRAPWVNPQDGALFLGPLFVLCAVPASYLLCVRAARKASTLA
jgi:hypothetical protein